MSREQPSRQSASGFIAHKGVKPVLWTDFNIIKRPLPALRGNWVMEPGQIVILDDGEGTRCEGRYLGVPTWDKTQTKYVLVEIDNDSFNYYEVRHDVAWAAAVRRAVVSAHHRSGVRAVSRAYRGDVTGWGPTRAQWYSFCSRHRDHAEGCTACNAGTYINDWKHTADSLVYRRARRVWLWWHNRPNSASRRLIESHFPRLRRGR